jgi:hypothetical protein
LLCSPEQQRASRALPGAKWFVVRVDEDLLVRDE